MRKLGKGQSVVFCVPGEIQTKILAAADKANDTAIDVSDVLIWSIHETHMDLRRCMPLWAAQGVRFERQKQIWKESRSEIGISMSKEQAERFLEHEALSLDIRYRPHGNEEAANILRESEASPQLNEILERCKKFDSLHFASATLQEEQERELSPEVEQERQVERPPPAKPELHNLHEDVWAFVQSAAISPKSSAFLPAFQALSTTSAAAHLDTTQFPRDLLVTLDFARTVEMPNKKPCADAYQRPVQWILTSTASDHTVRHMVIISPFEAQELMPVIKKSAAVFLHLYAPRTNLAFRPLDNLKLYTAPQLPRHWRLPSHLPLQLNLFCGQLYLGSFDEYKRACDFLCLAWHPSKDGVEVEADGFIISKGERSAHFDSSPTKFLKVLFTKIRRNCEGIDKTHWGKVLGGELLRDSDFEDTLVI